MLTRLAFYGYHGMSHPLVSWPRQIDGSSSIYTGVLRTCYYHNVVYRRMFSFLGLGI